MPNVRPPASLLALLIAACATPTAQTSSAPATPTTTAESPVAAAPVDEFALPPIDADFDLPLPGVARGFIVFGMTRPIGARAAIFSAKKLNEYLSARLGAQVRTKLLDDANALGDALSAGAVDAAWLTPIAFVRASERAAVAPLLRLDRKGFLTYRSAFVVKASGPLKSLADVKGKKMAWVGGSSASGRIYPHAHLHQKGFDPATYFGTQVELADHSGVCRAVLDGTADVGATLTDEVTSGAPRADGCVAAGLDPAAFRVIERTDSIPNDVIATRVGLEPETVEALRLALLAMKDGPDGGAQMREVFNADGFGAATAADFDVVKGLGLLVDMK